MKEALIILFVILAFDGYSQDKTKYDLFFPEMRVAYAGGYAILVQIDCKKKRNKISTLICKGCDSISRYSNPNNQWILIPSDSTRNLELTLLDKKGNKVGEEKIKVLPFPKPIVSFDKNFVGTTLREIPNEISLTLNKSIPLNVGFVVKSWKIKVNDSNYTGIGRKISEEVIDKLNIEKRGNLIIEVEYISPIGIQSVTEIFEFELK